MAKVGAERAVEMEEAMAASTVEEAMATAERVAAWVEVTAAAIEDPYYPYGAALRIR